MGSYPLFPHLGFRLPCPLRGNVCPWEKGQFHSSVNKSTGSSWSLPMRKLKSERPGSPWVIRLEPIRLTAPSPFTRLVRQGSTTAHPAAPTWLKPAPCSGQGSRPKDTWKGEGEGHGRVGPPVAGVRIYRRGNLRNRCL